ncbi:GrpB family protein [Nostoc flagelliforme FACHB-838]|uniref:GrpB family protein n=1 Tax=Nostoc flagelliforme FACHB-838 TaxID=2692904 RepID=A0ABR8E5Y1_9NOSO|nr:GrpB family protein [Nostoc flagelliforme]MBD2536808.1 GrpB family protein [Nostoc flagelliforme FACHB-838]
MDEIEIVEYDPCWPTLFEEEAARIFAALGNDKVIAIEHFGSTAIPGLAAKPVIDLMVGVHSIEAAKPIIPLLEALEYIYWPDDPRPGRMFFVKGMPPYGKRRTHHVHVVEAYSEFWERLLFRDYLLTHPEEAKRYEVLKRNLAERFQKDREGYTNGKSIYIQMVLEKARHEQIL